MKKYTVVCSSLTFENDYNKIVLPASNGRDAIQYAINKISDDARKAGFIAIPSYYDVIVYDDAGDVVNEFFNFRIE